MCVRCRRASRRSHKRVRFVGGGKSQLVCNRCACAANTQYEQRTTVVARSYAKMIGAHATAHASVAGGVAGRPCSHSQMRRRSLCAFKFQPWLPVCQPKRQRRIRLREEEEKEEGRQIFVSHSRELEPCVSGWRRYRTQREAVLSLVARDELQHHHCHCVPWMLHYLRVVSPCF